MSGVLLCVKRDPFVVASGEDCLRSVYVSTSVWWTLSWVASFLVSLCRHTAWPSLAVSKKHLNCLSLRLQMFWDGGRQI